MHELLKKAQIHRDDIGRFEKKGTLAKAAKFKQDQPAKRRPGGTPFQPGVSGNPAGKPRGTLNQTTLALKEAILRAGEIAGGEEGLIGYLTLLARNNSSAYAGLLAKILPHQLAADAGSNGGRVKISFQRIVCWPDGRKEIEGVTPAPGAPGGTPDDTKAIEP